MSGLRRHPGPTGRRHVREPLPGRKRPHPSEQPVLGRLVLGIVLPRPRADLVQRRLHGGLDQLRPADPARQHAPQPRPIERLELPPRLSVLRGTTPQQALQPVIGIRGTHHRPCRHIPHHHERSRGKPFP